MEFCIGDKTSKFSTLKNAIFEGYESDAKPDGKIDVQSGLMVTDFNLCPKKEVICVKFAFSKKATKFNKIFTFDLTLCSKCQIDGKDFVNFCGLLRKHEL